MRQVSRARRRQQEPGRRFPAILALPQGETANSIDQCSAGRFQAALDVISDVSTKFLHRMKKRQDSAYNDIV